MIFPGAEVVLTSLQFSGSPFVPLLKIGVMFPFFHSLGTGPVCHDFSDVMESGFTTPASSLRTLRMDTSHQAP